MNRTIAPAGDLAVRLTIGSVDGRELVALARAARSRPGVLAAIPAAESILVLFEAPASFAERERIAASIRADDADPGTSRSHRIEVAFAKEDAPDLPRLLARAGIDRAAFLDAVSRLRLRVRFLGFRPGFAYLEGIPEEWHLPRLETPRPRVPAGSFALAGSMAGFYPEESPGGWNLIGRSTAPFWDARRGSPNLFSPGDEVMIVPVETVAWPDPEPTPAAPIERVPLARVMRPATAVAIVAAPDPRRLRWGLPASGPFDVAAAIAANHNVGNDDGAAVLECAISGPVLRVLSPATLSWCGGSCALSVSGEPVRDARSFVAGTGDELEIGRIGAGARGYLAVRGGFAPPPSAALPAVLRVGDSIEGAGEREDACHFRSLDRATPREITVIEGPDPIDAAWRAILEEEWWEVTPRSDRAGVRLTCARKPPGIPASLPSSGMLFGTIQWLPDGDLVAMGPDHPITGGYLQPATIPSAERWKLAQLRPGDRVRWKLRV